MLTYADVCAHLSARAGKPVKRPTNACQELEQVLIAEHEAALLKLEQQAAAVLDDRQRVTEVNRPTAACKQTYCPCKETY